MEWKRLIGDYKHELLREFKQENINKLDLRKNSYKNKLFKYVKINKNTIDIDFLKKQLTFIESMEKNIKKINYLNNCTIKDKINHLYKYFIKHKKNLTEIINFINNSDSLNIYIVFNNYRILENKPIFNLCLKYRKKQDKDSYIEFIDILHIYYPLNKHIENSIIDVLVMELNYIYNCNILDIRSLEN